MEIQAISEIYNRPVEVFDARGGARPHEHFQAPTEDESSTAIARSQPLRLSYHGGRTTNEVDPARPDVGEGLGLGMSPASPIAYRRRG